MGFLPSDRSMSLTSSMESLLAISFGHLSPFEPLYHLTVS
ncbi:MAG: hypothetical protein BSOLF_2127 [Candidatus Carbobacillus altaicus]|uniref:Uncharacterized protein n=1 Tax=Candidatus Carbonibacillus altaicus TaxID=2163959 RepID=A0A2R6XYB6_9BACL|nr:MAG: hypothetical protein BSOLF_2127 [Candidatus Carbobacillus altaicus]